jgi:hypothetical protein
MELVRFSQSGARVIMLKRFGTDYKDIMMIASLVLFAGIPYLQSFNVPLFPWDDDMYITKSEYILKGDEKIA